jgi:hypothetical protein
VVVGDDVLVSVGCAPTAVSEVVASVGVRALKPATLGLLEEIVGQLVGVDVEVDVSRVFAALLARRLGGGGLALSIGRPDHLPGGRSAQAEAVYQSLDTSSARSGALGRLPSNFVVVCVSVSHAVA